MDVAILLTVVSGAVDSAVMLLGASPPKSPAPAPPGLFDSAAGFEEAIAEEIEVS